MSDFKALGPYVLMCLLIAGILYQSYYYNNRHITSLEIQLGNNTAQLGKMVDLLATQGYVVSVPLVEGP